MQTFAGLRDSSLPKTRASTCSVWNRRIAQYYSQCGKIISPIPFALNIVKIFIWLPNISHIDAVAPRQQRSRISTIALTLIVVMTIDRPCRQCSRSSVRQSVSTTFSAARRSTGAVTSTLTLILTIDWPCRQSSRSSMSAIVISQHEPSK